MKKILSIATLATIAIQLSAQTAFTIEANDTTYSFPLTSKITITDNKIWDHDADKEKTAFKSNYARLVADFKSSFATATQQSETGVESYDAPRLIGDYLWELDFTTNEYKRVQLMVNAYTSATDDSNPRNILANKSNAQENLGSCNTEGATGNYFRIANYGKDGHWAWIYNELTNTYAIVNRDAQKQLALDLSSLAAKVDNTAAKDLNIDNISGKWKFKALIDDGKGGTKDTLIEWRLNAEPFTDRYWTVDGIPYKTGTGRVKVTYNNCEILGMFPDEADKAMGHDWDFHFTADGLSGENYEWQLRSVEENTADTLYSNYPDFKIQDRNTLVSTNGMTYTMWKKTYDNDGKHLTVTSRFTVPAGTTMRRSSTYPDDVVTTLHDTVYVTKHDTVYIEKHDTVEIKKLTAEELVAAGKHASEILNTNTHLYEFASDAEFKEYASYYSQATEITDTNITNTEDWETAITQLKKVETAYGYYSQNLMKPASMGKYLYLGQGGFNPTQAFHQNFKMNITEGTSYNGFVKQNSGYIAYAKTDVDLSDTTAFANMFTKYMNRNACFDGLPKVDMYVIYNPCAEEKEYFPIYLAEGNGMTIEQWKGNTANNYATLDEAIQHFGQSSGNLAERAWIKINYDEEGARTQIASYSADFPDLSTYSDFEVITTCADYQPGGITTPGVSVDTSTMPLTYSKDGETCDFSGAMFLKAKNAEGDKVVIVVWKLTNGKYNAYAYELAE